MRRLPEMRTATADDHDDLAILITALNCAAHALGYAVKAHRDAHSAPDAFYDEARKAANRQLQIARLDYHERVNDLAEHLRTATLRALEQAARGAP